MINNITNVDTHIAQNMSVVKTNPSAARVQIPPILSFKHPFLKEKAELRTQKFKRNQNIIIVGDIDDDYVDTVEEEYEDDSGQLQNGNNFFMQVAPKLKRKTKYLKDCYVVDYIVSPRARCGLGTDAIKGLVEKAMFDPKIEGRIVTYSAPACQESSPAIFFYKLGFRFIEPSANERIKECIIQKTPDLPAQTGMMYLPKNHIHSLLRYGDKF